MTGTSFKPSDIPTNSLLFRRVVEPSTYRTWTGLPSNEIVESLTIPPTLPNRPGVGRYWQRDYGGLLQLCQASPALGGISFSGTVNRQFRCRETKRCAAIASARYSRPSWCSQWVQIPILMPGKNNTSLARRLGTTAVEVLLPLIPQTCLTERKLDCRWLASRGDRAIPSTW
jgi:hypothetical protein